jgi:hypothetical protein
VLAALLCCACGSGEEIRELTQWTLVAPSGARRAVTLPARFSADDMGTDGHIVLETEFAVPPSWRGGPVSVVLRSSTGPARLDADGVRVLPSVLGQARTWRIDAAARGAGTVGLRLDLDARPDRILTTAPRASPTENGDAGSRAVAAFNFDSAFVSTTLLGLLSAMLAGIFALDRRRVEYGWLALAGAASAVLASAGMGPPDALLARTNSVYPPCGTVAIVAAMFFLRRYLERPPPWKGWIAWMALAVALPVLPLAPRPREVAQTIVLVTNTPLIAYVCAIPIASLRSGPKRVSAVLLTGGYVAMTLAIVPDFVAYFGLHELAGGAHFMWLGMAALQLSGVAVIVRDYVVSMREIHALNEELRHQVAERSRELTEVLAHSPGKVAPAALDVGDVFDGRYRVKRALGQGGMGAVYEVERTRDARLLALKVVTRELSGRAAARFAREAEIGARVKHENLVSIVDVGIAARGTPFLVMELVEGGSLEDRRGRFGDVAWALPVLRQVAAGLAELHANHIVHRDLKPGNVLLAGTNGSDAPVAKISDFGISRFGTLDHSADVDMEGDTVVASPLAATPQALTQTGIVMGTLLYMAPEALLGVAPHATADVFSFGMLAYEALAGREPFPMAPAMLVRAHQPIPRPARLDGVSAEVAALVLACLRVDPAHRPRARELAEGL